MRVRVPWAIAALLTMVVAACSRQTEPMLPLEPATLRLGVPFDRSDDDALLLQAVERFEEEHPQITVELVSRWSSPPYFFDAGAVEALQLDAFLWGADPSFAGEEPVVLALEPFMGHVDGYADEDFIPHLLDIFRWDGALYAVPADVDVSLMYYNRDLFDARGVSYPQPGWDWQAFLATAEQMTSVTGEGDAQTGHWGFVAHANSADLFPFVVQHGGTLVDDPFHPTHFVFDDARAAEAVQWYADLGLQHRVMPIVEREQVDRSCRFPMDAFSLQRAAMVIGGVGEQGGDVIPWGFDWGAVPLPREQHMGTLLFAQGYYIAARTEHPQETWALIHSLSTSEQPATSLIPARRSVAESQSFRQCVGEDLADAALSAFDDDVQVMAWFFTDPYWALFDRSVDLSYWVVTGEDTADEMMLRLQDSMAEWTVAWE